MLAVNLEHRLRNSLFVVCFLSAFCISGYLFIGCNNSGDDDQSSNNTISLRSGSGGGGEGAGAFSANRDRESSRRQSENGGNEESDENIENKINSEADQINILFVVDNSYFNQIMVDFVTEAINKLIALLKNHPNRGEKQIRVGIISCFFSISDNQWLELNNFIEDSCLDEDRLTRLTGQGLNQQNIFYLEADNFVGMNTPLYQVLRHTINKDVYDSLTESKKDKLVAAFEKIAPHDKQKNKSINQPTDLPPIEYESDLTAIVNDQTFDTPLGNFFSSSSASTNLMVIVSFGGIINLEDEQYFDDYLRSTGLTNMRLLIAIEDYDPKYDHNSIVKLEQSKVINTDKIRIVKLSSNGGNYFDLYHVLTDSNYISELIP